jgi:LacI family gluconate utilization system Gnt-I transcriptional repressor
MLVGFSHQEVGRAVAHHLLAKGRKRLALISADDERASVRQKGFADATIAAGAAPARILVVPAPSTLALGRNALAEMLDGTSPDTWPDAVFCGSDLMAHGVLEEARARGLAVPRDLAIIGFGGLESTAHTTPQLSTVSIDRYAIGQLAAEIMLERFAGKHDQQRVIDVGFTIIDRETT